MQKLSLETLHAERDAKLAREQKVREDRARESERLTALNAWVADGDTEAEFERAWPEMRQKQRAERVMAAGNAARAEHFAHTKGNF